MKRHQIRREVRPGSRVAIVLKRDQASGRLTYGTVKDLLTSSPTHPRGIKVRLSDGQVGRVQEILESSPVEEDFAYLIIHDEDGQLLCGATPQGHTICLKIGFRSDAKAEEAVKRYSCMLGLTEDPAAIFSCRDGKKVFHLFVPRASLAFSKLPSAASFEWLGEGRVSELAAAGALLTKSGELFERLREEFEIDRA